MYVIKEFRHIFAWMDNRTNTRDQLIGWIIALESDKCLEADTDFDRSSGVAYTAVGGCSIE